MRPWLARAKVWSSMVTSITGLASGYFATIMHHPAIQGGVPGDQVSRLTQAEV